MNNIICKRFGEIDINDEFFASLKEDYGTDVIKRFKKTKDNNASIQHNDNKTLVGDTAKAEANTEIAKINLKINSDNVSNMENTVVGLKNVIITNGEFEVSADEQITINIENQIQKDNNGEEVQKISNIKEITTIQAEETEGAKSQEVNDLPNAGIKKNIMITIIGLIVLTIIFKIKSRKIKY